MAEEKQETAKHSRPNIESKVSQAGSTLVNSDMEKNHEQVDSGITIRLDGKRKTVGFKCVGELWDAFVPWSKEHYGSVCHVLEPIIVALMASEVNVKSAAKPLHIENLTIERAVRRVRRYSVEEEISESEAIAPKCHFCTTKLTRMFRYRKTGMTYPLCNHHARELMSYGSWETAENESIHSVAHANVVSY